MDISTIPTCRGCLKEGPFTEVPFTWPRVRQLFVYCTQIQIPKDDFMPRLLCYDCYRRLEEWNEFRAMCQENQDLFSRLIKENYSEFNEDLQSSFVDTNIDLMDMDLDTVEETMAPVIDLDTRQESPSSSVDDISKDLISGQTPPTSSGINEEDQARLIDTPKEQDNDGDNLQRITTTTKPILEAKSCSPEMRTLRPEKVTSCTADHNIVDQETAINGDQQLTSESLLPVSGTGRNKSACSFCSKGYRMQRLLNLHELTCKRLEDPFPVPEPPIQIFLPETKKTKISSDSGSSSFNFSPSSDTASTSKYQTRKTEKKTFRCSICEKEFASHQYRTVHIAKLHCFSQVQVEPLKIRFLRQQAEPAKKMKRVKKPTSRNWDHVCNFCEKRFWTEGHLSNHNLRHHQAPVQLEYCSICGGSVPNVIEHERTHVVQTRDCKCSEVGGGRIFYNPNGLAQHVIDHQRDNGFRDREDEEVAQDLWERGTGQLQNELINNMEEMVGDKETGGQLNDKDEMDEEGSVIEISEDDGEYDGYLSMGPLEVDDWSDN